MRLKFKWVFMCIPCMIFAMFLFGGISAAAADAVMLNSNKAVVGSASKENTYYFSNSNVWEFQAEFSLVKEWDTYVTYRVIAPDGRATKESKKIPYVDNQGKFTIPFGELTFTETADISSRNSVAPAGTYYVDLKYYASLWPITWDQKKDETIKVIYYNSNDQYNIPSISISDAGSKYSANIAVSDASGAGTSIITNVDYFFSADERNITTASDFLLAKADSIVSGAPAFSLSSSVAVEIEKPTDGSYKYLYVLARTGNGYSKFVEYNMESQDVSDDKNIPTNDTSTTGDTGLFDYDFGELILLALVVVLIVSCVLIITQKIIDYKKRLY